MKQYNYALRDAAKRRAVNLIKQGNMEEARRLKQQYGFAILNREIK